MKNKIHELKEQIELLYISLSQAGNLPEDEEIYNKIEDLEKQLKILEG